MRHFLALLLTVTTVTASAMTKPPAPAPAPQDLGVKSCAALPNTLAQTNPNGSQTGGRYCIWKSKCPKVTGTLWYLPGLGEDENSVDGPGGPLTPAHTEFTDMAVKNCLNIVSISYSRPQDKIQMLDMSEGWMIRPPGTLAITPPSPPWTEVKKNIDYVAGLVDKPFIGYGQSMGGYNAFTIASQAPDFFSLLLLTHPVMGDAPNFDKCPQGQIVCNTYTILVLMNFLITEWQQTANPVNHIMDIPKFPKSLVGFCPQDEFGLYKGPKQMALEAKGKGFDVTSHEFATPCKHTDGPDQFVLDWLKQGLASVAQVAMSGELNSSIGPADLTVNAIAVTSKNVLGTKK